MQETPATLTTPSFDEIARTTVETATFGLG